MKKSQVQMIEGVVALAFIFMIIFLIIGSVVSNSTQKQIDKNQKAQENLITLLQDFQNLPEIKYTRSGVLKPNQIDVIKLKYFEENLNQLKSDIEDQQINLEVSSLKHISKFFNTDIIIESVYPDSSYFRINFSFIDNEDKNWTPQVYAEVPVILVDDVENRKSFALMKVIKFVD